MAGDLIVTTELQDYLVAQSIGQLPGAAPSLTTPAIFDNPPDGAPEPRRAPRDGQALETATISLFEVADAADNPLAAWIQETVVEIVVRSDDDTSTKLLHRRIRDLLAPINDHGGRAMWQMNSLLVERSYQAGPEQPISRGEDRYRDRLCTYSFCCRRKALAGLPYAP